MTDTPTTPSAPVLDSTTPAPAPTAPAADAATPDLSNMTVQQLDAFQAQIEAARAARPPEMMDMLAQLRDALTSQHQEKTQAQAQKDEGKTGLDSSNQAIAQIHSQIRSIEFREAAAAAGFQNPQLVVDYFANAPAGTDVVSSVAALAAANPYMVKNAPAQSADIGNPATSVPGNGQTDAGTAALAAEIAASRT